MVRVIVNADTALTQALSVMSFIPGTSALRRHLQIAIARRIVSINLPASAFPWRIGSAARLSYLATEVPRAAGRAYALDGLAMASPGSSSNEAYSLHFVNVLVEVQSRD
ncbi:hypothetical protein MRB53_037108 [Persea americana]|nr:hypothetical protein MRB53_037108 [Persea americana]